jgi:hypothetical protein
LRSSNDDEELPDGFVSTNWRTVFTHYNNEATVDGPSAGSIKMLVRIRALNSAGWSDPSLALNLNYMTHPSLFPTGFAVKGSVQNEQQRLITTATPTLMATEMTAAGILNGGPGFFHNAATHTSSGSNHFHGHSHDSPSTTVLPPVDATIVSRPQTQPQVSLSRHTLAVSGKPSTSSSHSSGINGGFGAGNHAHHASLAMPMSARMPMVLQPLESMGRSKASGHLSMK